MDFDFFDFGNEGWCTPTILVTIIGFLSVGAMSVSVLSNKDDMKRKGLATTWLINLLWTLIVISLMHWLCHNGKESAAWWVFGLMYLVPVALLFIGVVFWMYFSLEDLSKKGMMMNPNMM